MDRTTNGERPKPLVALQPCFVGDPLLTQIDPLGLQKPEPSICSNGKGMDVEIGF